MEVLEGCNAIQIMGFGAASSIKRQRCTGIVNNDDEEEVRVVVILGLALPRPDQTGGTAGRIRGKRIVYTKYTQINTNRRIRTY